jgi:hypothetical protein
MTTRNLTLQRALLIELDPQTRKPRRTRTVETPQNLPDIVDSANTFRLPPADARSRNGDEAACDFWRPYTPHALTHETYDFVIVISDADVNRQQAVAERGVLQLSRAPVLISDRDGNLTKASWLRVMSHLLPYRLIHPVQAGCQWLRVMAFKAILTVWLTLKR